MLSFKQFLLESLHEDTLNPRRQDYGTQEEYLQALRDASVKQKAEAQQMTSSAEQRANTLGKAETGLKVGEAATDAILSAGAVAVPGVGTALNAGVKGIKATIAGSQGDYGKSALYAADAALPAVGRAATLVSQTGKAAKIAQPALELAKDVGSYISNPVKETIGQGLRKVVTTEPVAKAVSSLASAGESLGLSQPATKLIGRTSLTLGTKAAAEPVKPMVTNSLKSVDDKLEQGEQSLKSNQLASNTTSLGRKRIGEV